MTNKGSDVARCGVKIYTPAYISDTSIKFKIPLYQRLFAWKKRTIEGLLGDLLEHFTNSKTCSDPYYLGIITQIYDSSDGYLVVIDGQQRITVLMLLAAYFSQKKHIGGDSSLRATAMNATGPRKTATTPCRAMTKKAWRGFTLLRGPRIKPVSSDLSTSIKSPKMPR